MIDKILLRCESGLTTLAVLSIFVMMLLTTADAAGRYLLNLPIIGAYEFTEKYLMLTAVYLGAGYTYRKGSNIRITLLVDHLPRQVKTGLNVFAQIFSIGYGFILVIPTFQNIFKTYAQKTTLGSIGFPLWPPYVTIPVGLLLMSLLMLRDLPRVRTGKSALFLEEGQTDAMMEKDRGEEGSQ